MLVTGEEMVEVCKPSIDYLQLAIEKSGEFIAVQERKLSKRVNKEELFDAFKKGGFLRSYTLRMKITGREFREKPLPAKSTTKSIPVASPPRR
jgi:hypothetical protein